MLLISVFNDSSSLVRQIHYPRPVVVRTVAMRDGPWITASVKREASWRKSNPSVPIEASSVKDAENIPVVSWQLKKLQDWLLGSAGGVGA
jgi:hypothetical protein